MYSRVYFILKWNFFRIVLKIHFLLRFEAQKSSKVGNLATHPLQIRAVTLTDSR